MITTFKNELAIIKTSSDLLSAAYSMEKESDNFELLGEKLWRQYWDTSISWVQVEKNSELIKKLRVASLMKRNAASFMFKMSNALFLREEEEFDRWCAEMEKSPEYLNWKATH